MKLSIITICLNNIEGLKRTVESVLGQTYKDFEYIVIDGGSTDGSKEYIASTQQISHWISEPDKGVYNAMNKAIRIAHGEYCIFMNSGDTFYSSKTLQQVIPHLNGGDFYVGRPMRVKGHREEVEMQPQSMSIDFLLISSINHQSTFTRTAILKERPYNEEHKIVSDWERFFKEWLLHGRSYIPLDFIIAYYHLDGISYTNMELLQKERKEVIDQIIPLYIRKGLRTEEELTPLERKIQKSMVLPPVQRDLKLLRNAFKFLLKDLLHEVQKKFKKQ